eukprot:765335-Hanusia_phi.AAC.5
MIQVMLTEAEEAMNNLRRNVERNSKVNKDDPPRALRVNWSDEDDIKALETSDSCIKHILNSSKKSPGSGSPFDVIVGTDVIFNVKLKSLTELQTTRSQPVTAARLPGPEPRRVGGRRLRAVQYAMPVPNGFPCQCPAVPNGHRTVFPCHARIRDRTHRVGGPRVTFKLEP